MNTMDGYVHQAQDRRPAGERPPDSDGVDQEQQVVHGKHQHVDGHDECRGGRDDRRIRTRGEQACEQDELDRRQHQDAARQLTRRQGERCDRQRLEKVDVIDVAAERPRKLHGESECRVPSRRCLRTGIEPLERPGEQDQQQR